MGLSASAEIATLMFFFFFAFHNRRTSKQQKPTFQDPIRVRKPPPTGYFDNEMLAHLSRLSNPRGANLQKLIINHNLLFRSEKEQV
jgi:hypothetical protein